MAERGRHVMADGSVWEVGSFPLDGTGTFQAEVFSQPFARPPSLFLTGQTSFGPDVVTVRARNVTTNGFEAALFEQESFMQSGHFAEEVGYLAIYSPTGSGSIGLDGGGHPYLLQSPSADRRFVPVASSALRVEEEQSLNAEVDHVMEPLSVLLLGNQLFAQDVTSQGFDTVSLRRASPEFSAPMEWGTVEGVTEEWTTVPLYRSYTNPVVVARPASARGLDPGVVQVRAVTGESFEVRYEEWAYRDGIHLEEQVFYMVAEAGSYDLDGLAIEAGTLVSSNLQMTDGFEPVTFASNFPARPALFSSVQTTNDADPVTTRVANVTPLGFDITMDEEEALRDGHVNETIAWIAIERGNTTTTDGRDVLVFDGQATGQATRLHFGQSFERLFPVLVADVVTTRGPDPVFLRYRNLRPSSVDLFLQEEQSLNTETSHVLEDLSIFVAE